MTALVQYADAEFTGPNVGQLDRLPAFIPAPGYDRRFVAQAFASTPDGTAVASWTDNEVSGTNMTAAGSGIAGATNPVVGTTGPHKVVRFDGVANALGILYLAGEPYTFTLAFYLPATKANAFLASVVDAGQIALFTNGANNVAWYGSQRATTVGTLGAGWHIITVVANGTETKLRIDDVTTSSSAVGATYERRRLAVGGSPFNANRARFDMAEVIHWPTALTPADVDAVHAALKGRYGI